MKEKKILKVILSLSIILSLILPSLKLYAVTNETNTEESTTSSSSTTSTTSNSDLSTYVKKYTVKESEVEETSSSIEESLTVSGTDYELYSITKEEGGGDLENTKTVEYVSTMEDLTSNSESYIRETFGETYEYSDDEGYSGTLEISDISIQTVDQGQWEQIEDLDISFTDYTTDDLNNIEKTIQNGGYTYYLIDVDWVVQSSISVDGVQVPQLYSGTMHYERVGTYDYADTYDVTVTYSGEVTLTDPYYTLLATYTEVEVEVVEEVAEVVETDQPNEVPVTQIVVVSLIGLILIILLIVLLNKNATVYNKDKDGNLKKIMKVKLSTNKLTINLKGTNYKSASNLYVLEIKQKTFDKIKSNSLVITKDGRRIVKSITSTRIDFTI